MKGYVCELRLPIVLMASLLGMVSFRIDGWILYAWIVSLFIAVAASATMAQNAWRDRHHDQKRGRTFVASNERSFRILVVALWVTSFLLSITLWTISLWYGILSVFMIISGLTYSETRQIPLLPALIVAITSASCAIYADPYNDKLISLFLSTTLWIFAREILKDLDDCSQDHGYKWTIPLKFGIPASKRISGIILLLTSVIISLVSIKVLPGMIFLLSSTLLLLFNKDHGKAKTLLDLSMATILIVLVATGA